MAADRIPPLAGIFYALPGQRAGLGWLPQLSLSSVTELHDTASRTSLFQTFINPSSVFPIDEAKFNFPLYESSAVVSFKCTVGTRIITGVVKDKEEASSEFRAAVGRQEPASLLEQHTADIFTTSLGKIDPDQTVKVEIEYIMELKHDAEVDGLRFTIPTNIAPRYGTIPSGYNPLQRALVTGIDISVKLTMPGNVQSLQSPSHPIAIYLGSHTTGVAETAFNPKLALATLTQPDVQLDRDFVLLIKCAGFPSPAALLESHPTIPNSKALMVTLVPKFRLPEGPKPEIVFIVDRSGSMTNRVAPLKSSLSVFLRSLPLGTKFNICSFGTSHSFLWPQSCPYTERALEEAQRHVDGMYANFGGTELLPPIQATISRRLRDQMLEIMVLTDGKVWNVRPLFEYVERETARGDVRLFSLGIGQDVSHSLVDGLARAGKGFSQVIMHEREGMESKVARMLRGALSTHINDYRLDWEGRPSENANVRRPRVAAAGPARSIIDLFDANADADALIPFPEAPNFVIPNVLQAPYKLQSLFPFSRSTAYVIFSDGAQPPSHVRIRGTTPSGVELQHEIAVQSIPQNGQTIHQLAARKILQELEDGVGYLHNGACGIRRETHPGTFESWVKREGVRVGLKYGLASKWTSFLAVIQIRENMSDTAEGSTQDAQFQTEGGDTEGFEMIDDDNDPWTEVSRPSSSARSQSAQSSGSVPVMMAFLPPPPAIEYPTKSSTYSKLSSPREKSKLTKDMGMGGQMKSSYFSSLTKSPPSTSPSVLDKKDDTGGASAISFEPTSSPKSYKKYPPYSLVSRSSKSPREPKKDPSSATSIATEPSTQVDDDTSLLIQMVGNLEGGAGEPPSYLDSSFSSPSPTSSKGDHLSKDTQPNVTISYTPTKALPAARLMSETSKGPLSPQVKMLISLQTYGGHFVLSSILAEQIGVPLATLEDMLGNSIVLDDKLDKEVMRNLWATVLVIALFESKYQGQKSVWELVVAKARIWIFTLKNVEDGHIRTLKSLAKKVVGGI